VNIAEMLRKHKNFHSLLAVVSGLNNSAVYRLKHTRDEIPEKSKKAMMELEVGCRSERDR
jgi:hypothetical protein